MGMMRKMLGCCGPMMAGMMQNPVSPGHGCMHGPVDETGQPSQNSNPRTAGCGCGAMKERLTDKCFEGGRDEEDRRQD